MRVVLDTNVIVSGALTSHGTCARILDLLSENVFEICGDDRILDEYESVLRRPELRIAAENIAPLMELIRRVMLRVAAVPAAAELPDPDDLPFLETAAAGGALLVTGNIRHYPPRARAGVTVMSPADFLKLIRRDA
jgi:putative PIN family toxin of toxin-antitoxin system